MGQKRPDIFSYHDYKTYLGDLCAYLKATVPGFNVAKLAQDSKVSKGYLSMVLSGERKLTLQALQRIAPHLQLANVEINYLSFLCSLAKAKSQSEKARAIEGMQKLRSYQKCNPEEAVTYRYLTRWYYAAIREMAAYPDFKLEARWIQKRLRETVPLSDIEKAIDFLVEHKFLEVDQNGKVRPPRRRIECIDEVYKTAMLKYHEQVFALAIEHVPKLDRAEKTLTAHMTAISHEGYAKIKSLLEETMQKIITIAAEDKKPEALYQFSLLGFNISKPGVDGVEK